MDIYTILASKPHNSHYLNHYIVFIESCKINNKSNTNIEHTEAHHICPKAKDLFLEYKNLKLHPWNKIVLSKRQHFIAHILLWKSFPDYLSQMFALWLMSNRNGNKLNSVMYEKLKDQYTDYKYKTIIPEGLTRIEFKEIIEIKKEKEKQLLKELKTQEKHAKEKEKQLLKELAKYKKDNDLVCCLSCKSEMKLSQYKWHYTISFGNCPSITSRSRDGNSDEWQSPKSLRKKKIR